MELTDENLDYPDCRTPNPNSKVAGPAWLEEMVAKRQAEKKAAARGGSQPTSAPDRRA